MKTVMIMGIIIIIISTLFIVMIFNVLIRANVKCLGTPENPGAMKCNLQKFNIDTIFGLMMIGFFIVLDIGALYMFMTGWKI
jgi:hypothetical protein